MLVELGSFILWTKIFIVLFRFCYFPFDNLKQIYHFESIICISVGGSFESFWSENGPNCLFKFKECTNVWFYNILASWYWRYIELLTVHAVRKMSDCNPFNSFLQPCSTNLCGHSQHTTAQSGCNYGAYVVNAAGSRKQKLSTMHVLLLS